MATGQQRKRKASRPSGGSAARNAEKLTAQELVGWFVDRAREVNGAPPPREIVGHVAKHIDKLRKEGLSSDILKTAIDVLIEKGLDPSSLSSAAFTAQARLRGGLSYEERTVVDDYVRDHGWPTGWAMHRGTHGVTFVEDPLGHDKPTYAAADHRPTRRQLLDALRSPAA